jgi:DNA-directed RNA polymerase subunit N (RpoN/RPB10)
MCGYSPLAGPLLKSGYHITGFDNNRKVIRDVRKMYPSGKWICASYKNLKLQSATDYPFSVFLLLGASEVCCQRSFISSLDKLLNVNKPRMFFLETNKSIEKAPTIASPFVEELATMRSVYLSGYNAVLKFLIDHSYEVTAVGQYDAQFNEKWATDRIYVILRAKN